MTGPVRTALRSLAAFSALTAVLTMVPSAAAEPSPRTVEARAELDRINREVALAAEEYNAAEIELQDARRAAARAQARVAVKEAAVAAAARGIADLAAAAYRSGGSVDPLIQLMTTSTPGTFLDKAATIDVIAKRQSADLRAVRAARRALRHEQELARDSLSRADAIAQRMARTRADIERKLVRQQALVQRLESADARRERLAREAAERRAAQVAAARERARELAAAEAARKAEIARRASRVRPAPAPVAPPAYSEVGAERASIAVQEAYRQLGKPYRWGAEGPDSFDCSGLSKWAWAKAGVSLPHYSRAQYQEGRHVSRGELRPGDLVFFGNPIHHLGIYVGNGQMIHAPQTGDVVKVSSMDRRDYTGAVRL
ncbi:MAG TPA: C40 family peptidase [Frankiaceae bacterium]|nr:C40 family peptidase [Frankiaceae bacterium]